MPWFKVDDTFAMHEKVMAAGNAAIGLWVRSGAWSMQQLTDGFVPNHVLRALGTPKERRTLVEVSLWDEAEGGITFRNWDERQPTKIQVEAARQAAAERQRHARERAKSQRESRRDNSVSHGPPDPTRPDPSLVPTELTPSGGADKPRSSRARRLPDDFAPSVEHKEIAEKEGVDLEREFQQFCDYWRGNGKPKVDWNATLRNWLRSPHADRSRSRNGSPVRHLPTVDQLELPPDGLSPEEYAEWDRDMRARRASR